MGRRVAERKWIKTPVKLYNPVFGEFSGNSLNISNSGIFVEIDPFVGLEIEKEQKLVFLNSANSRVVFNIRFVRTTEQGVAFQFVDYETAGVRYPIKDLRHLWKLQQSTRQHVA